VTALPHQTFHFRKVSDWQWVLDHMDYFWSLSRTHLYLALAGVVIGFALALPLGVLAVRVPRTSGPILTVTTIVYALPAIAVFAFLLGITGLSNNTVIIPLAAYAATILVRSVTDGLRSVSEDVRLAATAMGYGSLRRVVAVEIPVALPVIVAGLRVATVASISLVTVGALIGIGGLGKLFTDGEATDYLTEILAGVVLVLVWALVFDGLLLLAGRALTPWARRTA
jgi:osmoprotectant transport system permease protein